MKLATLLLMICVGALGACSTAPSRDGASSETGTMSQRSMSRVRY